MLPFFVTLALASPPAVSVNKIYDAPPVDEAVGGAPYFQARTTVEKRGDSETVSILTQDREGQVYSRQEIRYVAGAVSGYSMEGRKDRIGIEVRDGRVRYASEIEGKKVEGEHPLPAKFVIGASLRRYIEARYDELAAGRELEVEMGLPMLAKTLSFLLRKVEGKERSVVEGRRIKVELKPSSVLVRAMMSEAHYFLDTKSRKLARYVGPTEFVRPGEKKGFIGTIDFGE